MCCHSRTGRAKINTAFPYFGFKGVIMAKGAGKARKKLPKELAVVRADNCTGCEACIEVCPVDCIYKVPGEDQPSLQSFVDIDLERCIGCALCERWCPWDAIDMVDYAGDRRARRRQGRPAGLRRQEPGTSQRRRPDAGRPRRGNSGRPAVKK